MNSAVSTWSCICILVLSITVQNQETLEAGEHLAKARSYFDQRKFAEAAEEARRARELDETNVDAWKLSGLSLQLAGRFPDAAREFRTALSRSPEDPDLWFYLARVLYLNHELAAAENAVRRALEKQTSHADAVTQLGMIQEAKQQNAAALKSYETAIELHRKRSSRETMPLRRAGELLMKLGRLEESLSHWTAAAELDPRSSEIRLSRGRVSERLGRRDEARREYLAAMALGGGERAQSFLERLESGNAAGSSGKAPAAREASPVRFSNAASRANLHFVLRNSATPNRYQVETMPGGVAALDYNGDGRLDIYFINGAELPSLRKTSAQYWNRLFRNNGDGTFADVTTAAGVAGEGYSMGVAAADYDNDGDTDLFVAGVNRNILFQNNGDGTFGDVTARAGLEGVDRERGKMWSLAAAWIDFDRDGRLDLFVVNYCKWDPSRDPYCGA